MKDLIKRCEHCRVEFLAGRGGRFCSQRCNGYRGLPCAECGKATSSLKMPKNGRPVHRACKPPPELCRICSGPMAASTTGAAPGRRAHRRCWREIGIERVCEYRNCGAGFTARQDNQTFCKQRCAMYESQFRLGPDCALCGEKVQGQSGLDPDNPMHLECRRGRWTGGACWKCGVEMNTERRKTCTKCIANGRTCAKEGCKNHHRAKGLCIYHYQDKYGSPLNYLRFSISRKTRREVAERDDGICQICDLPVDLEAHHLSMWAPALDHIIPVSHMLFADNSKQNLRLTHYTCNASRKDRTDIDHLVAARAHGLWAAK